MTIYDKIGYGYGFPTKFGYGSIADYIFVLLIHSYTCMESAHMFILWQVQVLTYSNCTVISVSKV